MTEGKTAAIALVAGLLAAIGVFLAGFQMVTREVPDTKMKGEEAAAAVAHVAELGFLVVHEKPSSLVPLGSVIDQVPKAGTRVLAGTAVLATVSLGPTDRIPALDLPAIPKAAPAAEPDEKLDPKSAKTADAKAEKEAKAERSEVAVPKLYRKRVSSAKKILENEGLKLGRVNRSFNEDLPFGVIFRQSPRPGNTVRAGSEVSVTINAEVD